MFRQHYSWSQHLVQIIMLHGKPLSSVLKMPLAMQREIKK